jgi:hypothetical protein
MQIFSRTLGTLGPQDEIMAWATDMTAYVSDKSGNEVALWVPTFGWPVGTLGWSMRVDGLAGVQTAFAPLLEDPAYFAKAATAREWVNTPAEDRLVTSLTGELGDPPPVGSNVTITTAVMAGGHYGEAIGWGLEMAARVHEVSGLPTIFGTEEFGTFGTVQWIAGAADAAGADAAREAINADETYLNMLSSVGDLFLPGSGHRSLLTRVA